MSSSSLSAIGIDSLATSIRVADEDVVAPVGVDVLHRRVIEESLQAMQPEQRVEHAASDLVFLAHRQDVPTRGEGLAGDALESIADQLPPKCFLLDRRGGVALVALCVSMLLEARQHFAADLRPRPRATPSRPRLFPE